MLDTIFDDILGGRDLPDEMFENNIDESPLSADEDYFQNDFLSNESSDDDILGVVDTTSTFNTDEDFTASVSSYEVTNEESLIDSLTQDSNSVTDAETATNVNSISDILNDSSFGGIDNPTESFGTEEFHGISDNNEVEETHSEISFKGQSKSAKEWEDWHTKRANDAFEKERKEYDAAAKAADRGDATAAKSHRESAKSWHNTGTDHLNRAKVWKG